MKTLAQQIEEEIAAVGGVLGDGFTAVDLTVIIESACKVVRNSQALWDGTPEEERAKVITDVILALDDKHEFTARLSDEFVAWDLPGLPDTIVDTFLNRDVVRSVLRASIGMLVTSAVRQLNRRSLNAGARVWQTVTAAPTPSMQD